MPQSAHSCQSCRGTHCHWLAQVLLDRQDVHGFLVTRSSFLLLVAMASNLYTVIVDDHRLVVWLLLWGQAVLFDLRKLESSTAIGRRRAMISKHNQDNIAFAKARMTSCPFCPRSHMCALRISQACTSYICVLSNAPWLSDAVLRHVQVALICVFSCVCYLGVCSHVTCFIFILKCSNRSPEGWLVLSCVKFERFSPVNSCNYLDSTACRSKALGSEIVVFQKQVRFFTLP